MSRTAIVTAGDAGIGKATAVALARAGCDVGITWGIPMGRPGDAREVAHVIAHLASPEASYTTGASYVVDGGLMLMPAMANVMAKPDED